MPSTLILRDTNMIKLYYDGDSFAGMLPAGQTQHTGTYLSQDMGMELWDYSFPGKNPQKIIRNAMRWSFEQPNSFMVIGIGCNDRLEQYTDDKDQIQENIDYLNRTGMAKCSFETENSVGVLQNTDFKCKEHIDLFHWQYLETTTLFGIIALHDYLLYNKINFVIHNLGKNFIPEHPNNRSFHYGISEQVTARPRILNFFKNSMHELLQKNNHKPWDYTDWGWWGHADETGHKMYANYLRENIKKYV